MVEIAGIFLNLNRGRYAMGQEVHGWYVCMEERGVIRIVGGGGGRRVTVATESIE
jgi:hypothetical protein